MISGDPRLCWSLSRKAARKFCPRGAVMHYREACGSCPSDHYEQIASAHRMIGDEKFIREMILSGMQRDFCRGGRKASGLTASVLARFNAEFEKMLSGTAPRMLYRMAAFDADCAAIREDISERLERYCQNIIGVGNWQSLLDTPAEYRRVLPEVLSMNINELHCYASALCAFVKSGFLNIVELRSADFDSAEQETALIHCFYAKNCCGRPPESVKSFVLDYTDGSMRAFKCSNDISVALQSITGEVRAWDEIYSLPLKDIPVNTENCDRCVFADICKKI